MSIPVAHAVAVPASDFPRPPLVAYVSQPAMDGAPPAARPAGKSTADLWQQRSAVLKGYNFPPGLENQMNCASDAFPMRFWIVDNSGSMATADGKGEGTAEQR